MKRYEDQDPAELLGVGPDASRDEIREAYERLSALLAPGSLAMYSVADAEEQRRLQRALRRAYILLSGRSEERTRGAFFDELTPAAPPPPEEPPPTPANAPPRPAPLPPPPPLSPDTPIDGDLLRRQREARGLTLEDVATRTRIRLLHLEAIEREDFAILPERVFARGFVMTYARELGLDPARAWAAIEPRFLLVKPPKELRVDE